MVDLKVNHPREGEPQEVIVVFIGAEGFSSCSSESSRYKQTNCPFSAIVLVSASQCCRQNGAIKDIKGVRGCGESRPEEKKMKKRFEEVEMKSGRRMKNGGLMRK